MSHTIKSAAEGLVDKASRTMGEMATDDVMASAIMRAVSKQERVNKLLREKGCDHRIQGFEIDNHLSSGVVFYVVQVGEPEA
jgi:hypothetical protein